MSLALVTGSTRSRAASPATSRSRRQWLSTVSHLDPIYGDLSAVVPQLASSLAGNGISVSLQAFCLPGEHYRPAAYPDLSIDYWPTSRKAWLVNCTLRRSFEQCLAEADGLHIHGLWEQSSLIPARSARRLRVPYIVSAHGMLEPWALARGRVKKRAYAPLFERATLNGAACLHALTRAEAQNYRDFGCTAPVAIIPNGVGGPVQIPAALFLEKYPRARGKRVLIFLGRLHRKKGVELLVRAWAGMAARTSDACLVIAGPSEDDTRARVEFLITQLGVERTVLLTGMLGPAIKWSALAAAECFVLPSYSEGLSIATLEAMGAGLPVIVTENCNLPEVVEERAGWQVQAEQQSLTAALEAWLQNPPAENRTTGLRGAALVRQRYSWATVSAQMAELYAWVEAGADRSAEPSSFPFLKGLS